VGLTQLENFDAGLILGHNIVWSTVELETLFYDDILKSMLEEANPLAGLRTSNKKINSTIILPRLLSFTSPIIAYKFRNHFRILTGIFTLNDLRKAKEQQFIKQDYKIPILLLSKKPSETVRRMLVQFDLTHNLITKCFINDTSKIIFYLNAWFQKDVGKRSIFQSEQWLQLYPTINTKDNFAKFLSLSKKDLGDGE
jgi:hypothetical protein